MTDIVALVSGVWPELTLICEIGQGANSRVYSAIDEGGETFAVKAVFIPDDWEMNELNQAYTYTEEQLSHYLKTCAEEYLEEVKILNALSGDKRIVKIYDYKLLQPEKLQYVLLIRMEQLTSLAGLVRTRSFTCEQIALMGIQICEALEKCHSKRIVHRDIKPSNILADGEGSFKLGDFGAGKQLKLGANTYSRVGTPQFIAPEIYNSGAQLMSMEESYRTDVYSLGLTLYWMLNRQTMPFLPLDRIPTQVEYDQAFMQRVNGKPLPAPCINDNPKLTEAVLKAADARSGKRFGSAAEMKVAILGCLKEAAPRKPARAHVVMLGAIILIFAAAVAVLLVQYSQRRVPEQTSPALPAGLNLPLPDKREYWNVVTIMPGDVWRSPVQMSIRNAFSKTPIEENADFIPTDDEYDLDYVLQMMIKQDFYSNYPGIKTDMVLIIPDETYDVQAASDILTEHGIPAYVFPGSDAELVYDSWIKLVGGVEDQ
ncbi:MAG: serine/threonine protein kinase [Clostridia bacterium]|nr:serine/threonine protein kinase [Clostridia bacterium]